LTLPKRNKRAAAAAQHHPHKCGAPAGDNDRNRHGAAGRPECRTSAGVVAGVTALAAGVGWGIKERLKPGLRSVHRSARCFAWPAAGSADR
jgi:hypothetical protein